MNEVFYNKWYNEELCFLRYYVFYRSVIDMIKCIYFILFMDFVFLEIDYVFYKLNRCGYKMVLI